MHWSVTLILSWLIADFISGLFHWWEDTYAKKEWYIIGPLIAVPNHIHHLKPAEFTKGCYLYRNYTTFIPSLIAAAVFYYYGCWLYIACLFLTQANELHCWSHMPCSKPVQWLQKWLIQSHVDHHAHHSGDHTRAYCVMSKVLNPVLDLGFWRLLERIISFTLKVNPRENY